MSYSSMLKKTDINSNQRNYKNKVSNENKKLDDTYIKKNPKIISKHEIEEHFDIKCSDILDKCFYSIKSDCDFAGNGILQNEEYSSYFDFYELIRNNVNLTHFYKKQFDS